MMIEMIQFPVLPQFDRLTAVKLGSTIVRETIYGSTNNRMDQPTTDRIRISCIILYLCHLQDYGIRATDE